MEAKVCDLELVIEQVIGKEAAPEAEELHEIENENDTDTSIDHSECLTRGFCIYMVMHPQRKKWKTRSNVTNVTLPAKVKWVLTSNIQHPHPC